MFKAHAMFLAATLALAPCATQAGGGCYHWLVSYSATEPFALTAPPQSGVTELYLWFDAASFGDGMTAAEFDVVTTGYELLGFTPMNGYLNIGAGSHLLLAVGSCPNGPVIAGRLAVNDASGAGGTVCLAASAPNPTVVTVNCDLIEPGPWPCDVWGASSTSAPPCQIVCTVAVEPTTWGSVKAQYR